MAKAPTIAAGPASSNDSYMISEDQAAGGPVKFNVRLNDNSKSTLYSLDDGQSADLLAQDGVLVPQTSRLGATIAITADGQVSYTNNSAQVQALAPGQTLQDSFLYAIRLQNGSLQWQTVTVNITGTNDVPVARADTAAAAEDAVTSGSVAGNDSDADNGAVLTFATTDQIPAGFSMANNGSWAFDGSNPAYQSLAAGQTQQFVIQYWVTDQYGASSSSTLTLTVTGRNDAPAAATASAGVTEDLTASGQLTATDADQASGLTFALNEAAPAGFVLNANGSWSFDASGPAYQSLGEGETRTILVRYAAVDSAGARGNAILTITVTGTNDAPLATAATATVAEGGTVGGTVIATDSDAGASRICEPYIGGPDGFALASDGSWTFDASQGDYESLGEGESENVVIDYVVTDDQGATSVSTLTITVTGENDAPTAAPATAMVAEDGLVGGQVVVSDVDANDSLTVEPPMTYHIPGFEMLSDGSWSFEANQYEYQALAEGETQDVVIAYSVADAGGAYAYSTLTVTITGTNDAPVTTSQWIKAAENLAASGTLSALDIDHGAVLTYGIEGEVPGGFVLAGDGSWTFDGSGWDHLAEGEVGLVQIPFTVADEFGASISHFLTLSVSGGDDPATDFAGALAGAVREDRSFTATGNVDFTDPDSGNDQWLAIIAPATSSAGYGSYTLNAIGQWTYTLDNGHPAVAALATGESLADTILLTTADGTTTSVAITINGRTDVDYVSPTPSTDTQSDDNDTLFSSSTYPYAPRTYSGGPYDDTIQGSTGNDRLTGNDGYDRIYGHEGDDTIYGDVASGSVSAGNDQLYGQAGNDIIYGGSGDDRIFGGSGNDILYANGTGASEPLFTADRLHGGSGDDTIYGGGGRDIITGGLGADYLVGGGERDQFYFHSAAETGDTIADFQQGIDQMMINNLYLSRSNYVGQLTGAGQVDAREVGYYVADGVTTVYIDTDGIAGADLEIHLIGTYSLTSNDFGWTG